MNDMGNKVILITGGTNGIGKAAALDLAKMGATVVIVGRNPIKTRETVKEIQLQSENPNVSGLVANLLSLDEIRSLADEVKNKFAWVNILINNAGAIFAERQMSVDGYELTFALNHLSYFLLTNLLLDSLKVKPSSRIINVSSGAHLSGTIRFEDLNSQYYGLAGGRAYAQSKLANLLFTYELARRLEGSSITVNAMSPGGVATGFGMNNSGIMRLAMRIFHWIALSPKEGADTIVHLASSPEVEGINGKYWIKRRQEKSSTESYDVEKQKRLWEISSQMTGLKNETSPG